MSPKIDIWCSAPPVRPRPNSVPPHTSGSAAHTINADRQPITHRTTAKITAAPASRFPPSSASRALV